MLSNCKKRAAPSINLIHWTLRRVESAWGNASLPLITVLARSMEAIETKGSTHAFHTQNQGSLRYLRISTIQFSCAGNSFHKCCFTCFDYLTPTPSCHMLVRFCLHIVQVGFSIVLYIYLAYYQTLYLSSTSYTPSNYYVFLYFSHPYPLQFLFLNCNLP